jgi:hypothetical protein
LAQAKEYRTPDPELEKAGTKGKKAFWRKKENPSWQEMISPPVSYTSTNRGDGSIRALK